MLKNAPSVQRTLEQVKPGLTKVLHKIIAQYSPQQIVRERYIASATDEQARLHYIELPVVPWNKIMKDDNDSIAIKEHIDIFFEKIFPGLQKYFGDKTDKVVYIITGYKHAVSQSSPLTPATATDMTQSKLYKQKMFELRARQQYRHSYYPTVLSIDASQGKEATMIIADGSMQYRDALGTSSPPSLILPC